jgi:protein-S-isoprenylcysteine O-methyltransferase Ste14
VNQPGVPRLFRVARSATTARNLTKTLIQIVLVWGFALALLPAIVVHLEAWAGVPRWSNDATRAAGVLLFTAASGVGLWCAWLMASRGQGTPVPFDACSELIIEGPYRVIRNPMATSAVVQTLGVGLLLGSTGTCLLAVAGGVVWHVVIRPPEERFLVALFGVPYEEYRTRVRCWVPR